MLDVDAVTAHLRMAPTAMRTRLVLIPMSSSLALRTSTLESRGAAAAWLVKLA